MSVKFKASGNKQEHGQFSSAFLTTRALKYNGVLLIFIEANHVANEPMRMEQICLHYFTSDGQMQSRRRTKKL